ncbi:hypothetical protein [Bacillus sp. FJAT-29937]|uniref:hypothetical protein n=1 Tax=Bacillus sp. FJAT-29937 TaxID=1720553 RepID=UPI000830D84E|nr:hypothetical protein [Bacillus sp. FJAT-29937]
MVQKIIESNYNLAHQIKETLQNDNAVKKSCQTNPSGEITFSIRDGELQIITFKRSKELISQGEMLEKDSASGMKEESFKSLVGLLSNYVKKHNDHLYHLKIILNYQMNKNGTSFDGLSAGEIHEFHYKRRQTKNA